MSLGVWNCAFFILGFVVFVSFSSLGISGLFKFITSAFFSVFARIFKGLLGQCNFSILFLIVLVVLGYYLL